VRVPATPREGRVKAGLRTKKKGMKKKRYQFPEGKEDNVTRGVRRRRTWDLAIKSLRRHKTKWMT